MGKKTEIPELTVLEKDVLINGIAGNDFWDTEGCPDVWSDCIVDTCKVTKKEQISGVVSSLVKKVSQKSRIKEHQNQL